MPLASNVNSLPIYYEIILDKSIVILYHTRYDLHNFYRAPNIVLFFMFSAAVESNQSNGFDLLLNLIS